MRCATWPCRAVLVTTLQAQAVSKMLPQTFVAYLLVLNSTPAVVLVFFCRLLGSLLQSWKGIVRCQGHIRLAPCKAWTLQLVKHEGEPLPLGEWIHIALRCDLSLLEACAQRCRVRSSHNALKLSRCVWMATRSSVVPKPCLLHRWRRGGASVLRCTLYASTAWRPAFRSALLPWMSLRLGRLGHGFKL